MARSQSGMPNPRLGKGVAIQARGAPAELVIYEKAWQQVRLGMALGLYNLALAIWTDASARAPRDRPVMYRSGGASGYLDGKKVAGVGPASSSAVAGAKPTAFASFDFPAHLVELGTTNMGAQPFLVPAALSNVSSAPAPVAKGFDQAGV